MQKAALQVVVKTDPASSNTLKRRTAEFGSIEDMLKQKSKEYTSKVDIMPRYNSMDGKRKD